MSANFRSRWLAHWEVVESSAWAQIKDNFLIWKSFFSVFRYIVWFRSYKLFSIIRILVFFIYNFWHIRNFENLKTACERAQKTELNWLFNIFNICIFDGKKWKKPVFSTFFDSFSTITWKFWNFFENLNISDERAQKILSKT